MDDWVLVHMLLDFCVDRTGRLTLEKPHTYAEKGAHAMFKGAHLLDMLTASAAMSTISRRAGLVSITPVSSCLFGDLTT